MVRDDQVLVHLEKDDQVDQGYSSGRILVLILGFCVEDKRADNSRSRDIESHTRAAT